MDIEQLTQSLSGRDVQILAYLPYMFQDLWCLGGRPEIQGDMVRSLQLDYIKLLDLGCGKGCGLIYILKEQAGSGLGVDAIPEFIEEARLKAAEWGVGNRIEFRVEDFVLTLQGERGYNVVLYSMDSEILGSTEQCFRRLSQVLCPQAYAIVETVYPGKDSHSVDLSRQEFLRAIEQAGFELIQEHVWEIQKLKMINQMVLEKIHQRAFELAENFPQQQSLFTDYIKAQEQESRELESEMSCVTVLCRYKPLEKVRQ